MAGFPKITVYSSKASQWASVAHLTLAEKGYKPEEYDVEEIDLVGGENFNPEFLKIQPNGTIPALTSSELDKPLIESVDILAYLDKLRPDSRSLFPEDAAQRKKVDSLIAVVHQDQMSTNLILLGARDKTELDERKRGIWRQFVNNRQEKLEKYGAADPENPFYAPKTKENGQLHEVYNTEVGPAHERFFQDNHKGYKALSQGLQKLNSLLVLPYAAGEAVTAADFHIVPWLAHALWGAGGNFIDDFEPLEKLINKSDPEFKFGEVTKRWWRNISATPAFQQVFPELH
ncbi:hypothetical protein C7999DRAFT_35384 [Corynascus novoguineensis]|uniref:Glutathione S-transferase n=1 Tax=Corynascus novoguineensis TaxID=1126955 RepID=A0AAN7CP33_9PEZI|nr:hypothetical protein C7999DRAFT_35384 [Corynascus novoguineensis]